MCDIVMVGLDVVLGTGAILGQGILIGPTVGCVGGYHFEVVAMTTTSLQFQHPCWTLSLASPIHLEQSVILARRLPSLQVQILTFILRVSLLLVSSLLETALLLFRQIYGRLPLAFHRPYSYHRTTPRQPITTPSTLRERCQTKYLKGWHSRRRFTRNRRNSSR